jgi:hypothetical protein
MRLNDDKLELSKDIFGDLVLQDCPPFFKTVAENIIRSLNVGKLIGTDEYNTISELDRLLTIDYWRDFDGLPGKFDIEYFREWYMKATNPDLISRARRWLVENRYIILPTAIAERAQNAEESWRGSVAKGAA